MREMGVEPMFPGWHPDSLTLTYSRNASVGIRTQTPCLEDKDAAVNTTDAKTNILGKS